MGHTGSGTPPVMAWGVAARALPGQAISGDRHLITPCRHGLLMAVVDGLGHGEAAAEAASIATATLTRYAHESGVLSLVQRCDERLKRTRGVVMSLAAFHVQASTMTWLGVGNVEGVLLRVDAHPPTHVSLLLRGGVVGSHLPLLRAAVLPVTRGDTLVFATDGIRSSFADGLNVRTAPQLLADRILAQYRMGTDDALVLAVRYGGQG